MANLSQRYCYTPDAGLELLKPEEINDLKPQIDDESPLLENGVDGLSMNDFICAAKN